MTKPLPRSDEGDVQTSAEYGEALLVKIEWNTDFDGREIDPEKEAYPATFHGEFFSPEEAQEWMDAYPEDTDVHDMFTVPLNRVRPA